MNRTIGLFALIALPGLMLGLLATACSEEEETVESPTPASPSPSATQTPAATATVTPTPSPTASPTLEEAYDAIEALYRHQFENNASGQQQGAPAYYLELFEGDPPEEIVARFEGHDPPVRAASHASKGVEGVFDVETGRRGLIFRIDELTWADEDRIEARGGYFEGGLSASVNEYVLVHEDGIWRVAEDRLIAIS